MTRLEERFEALERTTGPDLWDDIGGREPRRPSPPSRSPVGRVGAIALAFLLTAAASALLVNAFTGTSRSPTPGSPSGEPLPDHAEVTQTVDVGVPYPSAIVVGEGGVWVAANGEDAGGDVVRLDPSTGDVVARIPVEHLPAWEFGGGGMATGLGSVWLTGPASDPEGGCCVAVLTRIDPSTNTVADTVEVGEGGDADVWVDESGIWVLTFASGGQEMWLYRLDPATTEVVARITVSSFWSQTVAGGGGWIWVHGGTPGAPPEGAPADTLFKVDPATNQIVDVTTTGGLAVFSGDVILTGGEGSEEGRLLDAATGDPLAEVASMPRWDTLAADGHGGFWFVRAAAPEEGGNGRMWHLDRGGVIDAEGTFVGSDEDASGITEAFDRTTASIWVVHYARTVSRIRLTGPA